jgi:hypothetical protein
MNKVVESTEKVFNTENMKPFNSFMNEKRMKDFDAFKMTRKIADDDLDELRLTKLADHFQ